MLALQSLGPAELALMALLPWMLVLKGIALWESARKGHQAWFILLLVIRTLGLLEILYIFNFSRREEPAPTL